MHFTEYDTRMAAYGLLTTEDGLILLTWFNGGAHAEPCWTMPGGGINFEESLESAVSREVFEETGYRVDVGQLLAEHHFTVPGTEVCPLTDPLPGHPQGQFKVVRQFDVREPTSQETNLRRLDYGLMVPVIPPSTRRTLPVM